MTSRWRTIRSQVVQFNVSTSDIFYDSSRRRINRRTSVDIRAHGSNRLRRMAQSGVNVVIYSVVGYGNFWMGYQGIDIIRAMGIAGRWLIIILFGIWMKFHIRIVITHVMWRRLLGVGRNIFSVCWRIIVLSLRLEVGRRSDPGGTWNDCLASTQSPSVEQSCTKKKDEQERHKDGEKGPSGVVPARVVIVGIVNPTFGHLMKVYK